MKNAAIIVFGIMLGIMVLPSAAHAQSCYSQSYSSGFSVLPVPVSSVIVRPVRRFTILEKQVIMPSPVLYSAYAYSMQSYMAPVYTEPVYVAPFRRGLFGFRVGSWMID